MVSPSRCPHIESHPAWIWQTPPAPPCPTPPGCPVSPLISQVAASSIRVKKCRVWAKLCCKREMLSRELDGGVGPIKAAYSITTSTRRGHRVGEGGACKTPPSTSVGDRRTWLGSPSGCPAPASGATPCWGGHRAGWVPPAPRCHVPWPQGSGTGPPALLPDAERGPRQTGAAGTELPCGVGGDGEGGYTSLRPPAWVWTPIRRSPTARRVYTQLYFIINNVQIRTLLLSPLARCPRAPQERGGRSLCCGGGCKKCSFF